MQSFAILKRWSALCALLVGCLTLNAQTAGTGGIQGRVLNSSTGDYLGNALVTVDGGDKQTLTDASGTFRIDGLPAGQVQIRVRHPAVVNDPFPVEVMAGRVTTRDFDVPSIRAAMGRKANETVQLDVFTVTTNRELDSAAIAINEQRNAANIKNVVSTDDFGDVTEGNIGDFAKFLPGVTVDYVASDARTISIRGVAPAFTRVTMNGAQLASANSSTAGRQFELEQVSLNNTARIEIYKSRTPDVAASALGGSVNLIPRSAFERRDALFTYRAFLSMNTDAENSGKSRGPASKETYKIRPGADFVYIRPVTRDFGFTISALHSDVFNEQDMFNSIWNPHSATPLAGGSVASPFLVNYNNRIGPKTSRRDSLGVTLDWRVRPTDTLSFSAQWNNYDAFFANRQNTLQAINGNVAPLASGPTFTTGPIGRGLVQMASGLLNKYGTTYSTDLKWQHMGSVWRINGSASFSKATNHYRSTPFDRFAGVVVQLRGLPNSTTYNNYAPTVSYEDIDDKGTPGRIVVKDNTGSQTIDLSDPRNYNLIRADTQPRDSSDQFTSAQLDAQRNFSLSFPLRIKSGVAVQRQVRDISRKDPGNFTFVGPDGVANSADDNYGLYDLVDPAYTTRFPGNGPVMPFMDNAKVYKFYLEHPNYWTTNPATMIINTANNSQWFEETISSAYLMGDAKLFERLRLVGGVRFEKTEDKGLGVLNDPSRIPAGVTDPVARAQAQYTERGFSRTVSYQDYYPSLDATINLTQNLQLRAAYAKSIGRPDLNFIIPGITLPDPAGTGRTITINNSALVPTKSDGYDLALEYYFKKTGVLSAGVFRKDFVDFNGSISQTATLELLEFYGVPSPETYADGTYTISTRQNVGDARVQGVEFNYRQVLDFEWLPGWARAFTVFANGQQLQLDGSTLADFSNFIRKTYSYGVKYSARRFTTQVNVNHRGLQRLSAQSGVAPGTYQYRSPRLMIDANAEYRWKPAISFFVNVRNLLNDPLDLLQYTDGTPDYARLRQRETFGAAWTFGVKGRF